MDWYGGLPLYRFYMVIPALAIVALDVILPYGVAFKIVALSGLSHVPRRLLGVRPTVGVPPSDPRGVRVCRPLFPARRELRDLRRQREVDDGGGVLVLDRAHARNARARTARQRGSAPASTASGLRSCCPLAAVSHGIVLIFVAVAATIICLVWIDKTRIVYARNRRDSPRFCCPRGGVGPFLFGHEFMTDMKYGFRPNSSTDSFWDMYFPR